MATVYHPQPRGRPPKGMVWSTTEGGWHPVGAAGMPPRKPPQPPRQYVVRIAPAPIAPPAAPVGRLDRFTEEEMAANMRRNLAESRALEDAERARAEERVREEVAQRRRDQPRRTAFALYNAYTGSSCAFYWMDESGAFHQCSREQPAHHTTSPLLEAQRPYEVRKRIVERMVTHHDDPTVLAPGEWEYRDVEETYRHVW